MVTTRGIIALADTTLIRSAITLTHAHSSVSVPPIVSHQCRLFSTPTHLSLHLFPPSTSTSSNMSQIRRKPVRNSWQDSMPRPLSTNRALLQEFRGHVHRDMPHELHAMDHPALQNGVCESRTLTPEVDQPNNYHYPHYADDDGDADLGMATMRPSSPLDHEGMAAFNNMNSATTHVTWIPQQWYNYQETRPQIPVDEVTLAPVSGETSHTPASDVEALSAVSIPPPPPPSPPNGGTTAWLQVAGAFLLFFSSW